MPTVSTILPEYDLVLSKVIGTLTERDLVQRAYATRDDPRFHPNLRQLLDLRDIEVAPEIDGSIIRRLATLKWYAPDAKRAMVATDDIVFGLARMYQMLREESHSGIHVFRSMDEALAYLDLTAARSTILDILAGWAGEG